MEFLRVSAFDKSLNALDVTARASLLAQLVQFEADYNRGVSLRELRATYEFKSIERLPGSGKTPKGEVFQLRPLADYRVTLLLVISQGQAYYVHTWRKHGKSDPDEIRTGKSRARNLLGKIAG